MIFTDKLAESFKECAGEKYVPSNGTEGGLFMDAFCEKCTKVDCCDIVVHTMFLSVEDEAYPKEWQYTKDGQPTCTEFEEE